MQSLCDAQPRLPVTTVSLSVLMLCRQSCVGVHALNDSCCTTWLTYKVDHQTLHLGCCARDTNHLRLSTDSRVPVSVETCHFVRHILRSLQCNVLSATAVTDAAV